MKIYKLENPYRIAIVCAGSELEAKDLLRVNIRFCDYEVVQLGTAKRGLNSCVIYDEYKKT